MNARLTPFTLRKAGFALYGEQWRSELARALGVTDRTVRRWVQDEYSIPDDARERIIELCRERAEMLAGVMRRLEK
jgi:predicted transcriptional regulator